MSTAIEAGRGRSTNDLLAPLFGEAWAQRPLDLLSDPIKMLASAGMLHPRSLKSSEVQALAAAVMAYIVEKEKWRFRSAVLPAICSAVWSEGLLSRETAGQRPPMIARR